MILSNCTFSAAMRLSMRVKSLKWRRLEVDD
jgi:hypothetical protein